VQDIKIYKFIENYEFLLQFCFLKVFALKPIEHIARVEFYDYYELFFLFTS